MEELCSLRSKICTMGFIDIILSTFGLTWLAYMYFFVVYDYRFKHYLGTDADCLERIRNIELKELNHQYMISLMLYGISMIGFLVLGFLLVTLSLQDPTRYFAILNLVTQFPFLVLTMAGCGVFFSDGLCSLNTIPGRFNDSEKWPLQVIVLCATILFIVYKIYELWVIASIIAVLSHKKANSVYISSVTQLAELPMAIEAHETRLRLQAEDDDDYNQQDHAKGNFSKDRPTQRRKNKVHSLPDNYYDYEQHEPEPFDNSNDHSLSNLHVTHPHQRNNGRNYITKYSDPPEDIRKSNFRKSIERAQRNST